MDCTAHLTRKLYGPKFSCARTKGDVKVRNIFAQWATTMLTQDLDQVEFVSLSTDSSNHRRVKLLPIRVRYCKICDGSMSIETKLIDFVGLRGETAEKLAAQILVMTEKFTLEKR